MSEHDPEQRAFKELETLVRHLGEELANFRRRAIAAEAQLRDGGAGATTAVPRPGPSTSQTLSDVEAENEALRTRLQRAEERVKQMLDRVRFLRQQLQAQATAGAHS